MEQKSHVPVRTASSQKIHTEWARALQKILQKLDGTTRFLNEYSSTRRRSEASMTQLQQLVQQSSSNIATEQKERIRRLSRSPMRRRLTALMFEQKNQSINEIPSEKEILRILLIYSKKGRQRFRQQQPHEAQQAQNSRQKTKTLHSLLR